MGDGEMEGRGVEVEMRVDGEIMRIDWLIEGEGEPVLGEERRVLSKR
jgi:hypothetical protein